MPLHTQKHWWRHSRTHSITLLAVTFCGNGMSCCHQFGATRNLVCSHHRWPTCCYNKAKVPVKKSSSLNLWFCGTCHSSNVPFSVWPGLTLTYATQLHDTSALSPQLEQWYLHCLSVQKWGGRPSSSLPAKYQRRTEMQKACKWVCETRGGTAKKSGPMGLG